MKQDSSTRGMASNKRSQKYGEELYQLFCEAFCLLPFCHLINHQGFVVHGGLFSQYNVKLGTIRAVNRNCEPSHDFYEGLVTEMLWSDPRPRDGIELSDRNAGVAFGPGVTQNFSRKPPKADHTEPRTQETRLMTSNTREN